MKILKYPIISITLFFAIGVCAGKYLKLHQWFSITLAIITFIATVISYFRSQKHLVQQPYFTIFTWFFSCALGTLSYSVHYALNYSTHYTTELNIRDTPVIKGVVCERIKPNHYNEKFYLDITTINKQYVTGRILINAPKDSTGTTLHIGDVLLILDDLKPISKPLNPNQFSYSDYLENQNIFHQLNLRNNYEVIGVEKNINYYLEKLRNSLSHSFDIHGYNDEQINILKALLLGQRQDMDAVTTANYTNAGVVHILAISGLHIAVLFYILNLLLRPLKRYKTNGKLLQLLLILSFLWLFAFISGLSASVVRSVVMFSFISIGIYFNRYQNIYNSIALSMLFLLLIKPAFLFDVGFQLSYAAVLAIVILQPVVNKYKESKYKVTSYAKDTLLVSLAAQVGVLPISLYYFNQFPLLFLIANLVVVPLSTLVLIIGITVLALNYAWPDAAIIVGKLLRLLINTMNVFIEWIASFDKLVIKNIPFNIVLTVVLYLVIAALIMWLYKKGFRNTVIAISSIIIFQIVFITTNVREKTGSELIVFHNAKTSLITIKDNDTIVAYSNDSIPLQNQNLLVYNKGNFNQELKIKPLNNLLWFKQQKILLLDSLSAYNQDIKPDIIILTQSPKVNLEKLIVKLKPRQIVADATNYKTYIKRWAATCRKEKIPFHATAEKGFFKVE